MICDYNKNRPPILVHPLKFTKKARQICRTKNQKLYTNGEAGLILLWLQEEKINIIAIIPET